MTDPVHTQEDNSGGADDSATQKYQGYYDWQVTTIMLAYDLNDPVDPRQPDTGEQRRRSIEAEVRTMTLQVVPEVYKNDPNLDWPPDLMMAITRTTLKRAADIAGL